jgi:hypothetical protein
MACAWVKVSTKEDKELRNTHYHEGLLVRDVQYGVLPQTAPLLFLRQLSPLFCTWQSVSRGQHCICSPITVSIAITHAQRGCMRTAPPWPTDVTAPRTVTPLRSSLFWDVVQHWMAVCQTSWKGADVETDHTAANGTAVHGLLWHSAAVYTSVPCTTSIQLLHFFFVLQLSYQMHFFHPLAFSMPLTASKNSFLHRPCTQCVMSLQHNHTNSTYAICTLHRTWNSLLHLLTLVIVTCFCFHLRNSSICLAVNTGSRKLGTNRLKFPPAASNSFELQTVVLNCAVPDWQKWLWSSQHEKWRRGYIT